MTEKKSQAKPNLLQTECLWRVSYKPPSFKYFLQWTSQPSKPLHTPYWDNLQGNKCIWESKVFWAFPLVSISQLHVFLNTENVECFIGYAVWKSLCLQTLCPYSYFSEMWIWSLAWIVWSYGETWHLLLHWTDAQKTETFNPLPVKQAAVFG